MRYKILSGLAVGLLATVGVAAPAQAISASSSDVYVVHGIPGLTVDVYVNDALTLENFEFGTAAGPLDLAAGDYKIQVFEADADPATATPAINVPAASVPANESVSLVAQYDESGAPTLGVFINDISTIPAGQGRLTVRHTGDITAGVAGAGTASPLVIPADGNAAPVTIVEGTNLIVYAVGASDSLQLITQSISGLHSTPGGVHSGTAGLAADANPTAIALGSAALLALLLAAALVGMRNRAAQSAGK
jgi:hypothetical protein